LAIFCKCCLLKYIDILTLLGISYFVLWWISLIRQTWTPFYYRYKLRKFRARPTSDYNLVIKIKQIFVFAPVNKFLSLKSNHQFLSCKSTQNWVSIVCSVVIWKALEYGGRTTVFEPVINFIIYLALFVQKKKNKKKRLVFLKLVKLCKGPFNSIVIHRRVALLVLLLIFFCL
jgi:hypothetical protein